MVTDPMVPAINIDAAAETARRTVGVVRVKNRLKVRLTAQVGGVVSVDNNLTVR